MTSDFPQRIPCPGGEIVIADEQGRTYYDEVKYAPARRAGDYVYLSGVVIARTTTPETFKEATRASFARMEAMLAAFDLGFDDVVVMTSFHDWTAPEFGGDRDAHAHAFTALKNEIMPTARPTWTVIGTSGLYSEDYVVEVQMTAYAPQPRGG